MLQQYLTKVTQEKIKKLILYPRETVKNSDLKRDLIRIIVIFMDFISIDVYQKDCTIRIYLRTNYAAEVF